jgi:hypothetical protein
MNLIARTVLILAGVLPLAAAQAQNAAPQHQHQDAPAAQADAGHGKHGRMSPDECPCCKMMMQRQEGADGKQGPAEHADPGPATPRPKSR